MLVLFLLVVLRWLWLRLLLDLDELVGNMAHVPAQVPSQFCNNLLKSSVHQG